MADDPRVRKQPVDISVVIAGDLPRIEAIEGAPEVVALAQDRQPRQAGLEALQAQLLEQPPVVVDRVAPLVVVVRAVQRVAGRPPAARPAVVADDEALGKIGHVPTLPAATGQELSTTGHARDADRLASSE